VTARQGRAPVDVVSGECYRQFNREHGKSQRFGDFTDDLLWLRRMLVTQSDFIFSECHGNDPDGFLWMVPRLYRGNGYGQQLHQSFNIRRQVS